MYGAILGDMIGAPYEFDTFNIKTKDFPLFSEDSGFTDDSVMTLAVAAAMMETRNSNNEELILDTLKVYMQRFGRMFPNAGYGGKFFHWIFDSKAEPYKSYGNGSAMRVASVPWLFTNSLEETRYRARLSAMVSHNHPEGIKGAESTASAIYFALNGYSKEDIRKYIEDEFQYDLSRTCDEIRPDYHHIETCQGTIPVALAAFFESNDYEDAVRTAVSLGGDSDTIACITGGIAEAFYGVPKHLKDECISRLPDVLLDVLADFDSIRRM